jgi:hypothetical protein
MVLWKPAQRKTNFCPPAVCLPPLLLWMGTPVIHLITSYHGNLASSIPAMAGPWASKHKAKVEPKHMALSPKSRVPLTGVYPRWPQRYS